MSKHRPRIRAGGSLLGALLFSGLLVVGACGGETSAKVDGADDTGNATATPDDASDEPDVTVAPVCTGASDCSKPTPHCADDGKCVACLTALHCPANQRCVGQVCIDPIPCKSDKACLKTDGVCDTDGGFCVDCLGNEDCGKGDVCKATVCVAAPKPCSSSKQCAADGQVCDKKNGVCADCLGADDCADNQYCSEGVCRPDLCTAKASACTKSGQQKLCREDGGGWIVSACADKQVCIDGGCKAPKCQPGIKECAGNRIAVCNAAGTKFDLAEDCTVAQKVCVKGQCEAKVCKPNAVVCATSKTLKVCSIDGTKATDVACPNGCKDAKCVTLSCKPNSKICLSASKIQVCNAAGNGSTMVDCTSDAACVAGACKTKVCTPGALSCVGKFVHKCNATGTDEAALADCGSNGKFCVLGACVDKLCKAGATKCSIDHKTVRTCAADGGSWVDVPCTGGTTCDGGGCMKVTCTAGQTECDGKTAIKCNALGTVATVLVNCGAQKKACKAGACVSQLCLPGTKECSADGKKLQTCAADGLSFAGAACPVGMTCVKDSCKAQSCTPGALQCANGKLYLCDAKGLVLTEKENCTTAGKYCIAGKCVTAGCGDGKVNVPGEQCDDGNQTDGDGCSSGCQDEAKCVTKCASGLTCLAGGGCGKGCKGSAGDKGVGCTLGKGGNGFDTKASGNSGVATNTQGELVLSGAGTVGKPDSIWIAGTGAKVLSKLNTATGKETARYHACNSGSRTAVDLVGDAWLGCRSGGQVMKVSGSPAGCVDKNGNGVIDTSKDTNGNGVIDASEMKPYGQDECVRFIVRPHNSENTIRAVGVDVDNHAWVGGWNRRYLWRLHPTTGKVVDSINLACNPYGLAIGKQGVIWVSGRGCSSLLRVDPVTKSVKKVGHNKGSPYGVAIDYKGRPWIANTNTYTSMYDPLTAKWTSIAHQNRSRGVTADANGNVYVALDTTSQIAVIDVDSLSVSAHISVGSGRYPVGVSVDFDGKVWTVNQSKSTTTKVDPNTKQIIGEYPVGKSPYTYSDMTGYALHNLLVGKGVFHTVFYAADAFNPFLPKKTWTFAKLLGDVSVPAGASVTMRWRVAPSVPDLNKAVWSAPVAVNAWPVDLKSLGVKTGPVIGIELTLKASQTGASPIIKSLGATWSSQ